ncbi:unnamed protein product [Acanthoscelides obtectus]|nr:unnamed protein product [Acanthoscelides obtectus]CAK1669005.1 Aquaporin AQPAe.a [Acanthoscelides obtectus]
MLAAECLGTFLLVFIGCASCIGINGPSSVVQISLTFGLTIGSIIQGIGHVSGGHVNPAVTISFFVTGDIKLLRAIFYIIVQCVGAIAGAGLLRFVVPEDKVGNLGITDVSSQLTPIQGVLMETILTFLLLFVVHGVCDSKRRDIKSSAGLVIGLAIAAAHLSGIPYTGSSINPARSIGPAIIMNIWNNHWVYWVGPILGGVIAGVVYKILFKARHEESDSYDF